MTTGFTAKTKDGNSVTITLNDKGRNGDHWVTEFYIAGDKATQIIVSKTSVEPAKASGSAEAYRQSEDWRALQEAGIDLSTIEEHGHPVRSPAEAKGIERGEALKHDAATKREFVRSSLEPAALNIVAVDPAQIALSQAISLKRIADALQPVNDKRLFVMSSAATEFFQEFHGNGSTDDTAAIQARIDRVSIEAVAGDMLNVTQEELIAKYASEGFEDFGALTTLIRRLASAVLRKAEK